MTSRDERGGELMLKECPFVCGGNVSIVGVGAWNKCSAVYCESCEIYGPMMATKETAAFAWNRRASARAEEGPITDAQVYTMCGYLQERCNKCPREIDTAYGRGTQGCYAIALETLEKARELLAPPAPAQEEG